MDILQAVRGKEEQDKTREREETNGTWQNISNSKRQYRICSR